MLVISGDHIIDVLFHNSMVNGSPFTCHVYDADQIIVSGIPSTTIVSKLVEFYSKYDFVVAFFLN